MKLYYIVTLILILIFFVGAEQKPVSNNLQLKKEIIENEKATQEYIEAQEKYNDALIEFQKTQ